MPLVAERLVVSDGRLGIVTQADIHVGADGRMVLHGNILHVQIHIDHVHRPDRRAASIRAAAIAKGNAVCPARSQGRLTGRRAAAAEKFSRIRCADAGPGKLRGSIGLDENCTIPLGGQFIRSLMEPAPALGIVNHQVRFRNFLKYPVVPVFTIVAGADLQNCRQRNAAKRRRNAVDIIVWTPAKTMPE